MPTQETNKPSKQQLAAKALILFKKGKLIPEKNINVEIIDGKIHCCPIGAMYCALFEDLSKVTRQFHFADIYRKVGLNSMSADSIASNFDHCGDKVNETFEQILTEMSLSQS